MKEDLSQQGNLREQTQPCDQDGSQGRNSQERKGKNQFKSWEAIKPLDFAFMLHVASPSSQECLLPTYSRVGPYHYLLARTCWVPLYAQDYSMYFIHFNYLILKQLYKVHNIFIYTSQVKETEEQR